VDDERPAEGPRHVDLRHPHLGGVLSSHPRAESPRHQVPYTDRAIPASQARRPRQGGQKWIHARAGSMGWGLKGVRYLFRGEGKSH
jgi:hypothetical protein